MLILSQCSWNWMFAIKIDNPCYNDCLKLMKYESNNCLKLHVGSKWARKGWLWYSSKTLFFYSFESNVSLNFQGKKLIQFEIIKKFYPKSIPIIRFIKELKLYVNYVVVFPCTVFENIYFLCLRVSYSAFILICNISFISTTFISYLH